MKKTDRDPQTIIQAAEKAISKISDPAVRAEAVKVLKETQKRVAKLVPRPHDQARQRRHSRERDIDFDR